MEMNLRKAASAVEAINKRIAEIRASGFTQKQISCFEDFDFKYKEYSLEFSSNVDEFETLSNVMYSIRDKIATENAKNGINTILSKINLANSKLKLFGDVTQQKYVDIEVNKRKLENLKESVNKVESFYSTDFIQIPVISEDTYNSVKGKIKDLKLQVRNLNDEILAKNITSTILLEEEEVMVLKDLSVI